MTERLITRFSALFILAAFGCATAPPHGPPPGPAEASMTASQLRFDALARPLRISQQDFSGADLASVERATPTTSGGYYLQAAMILDPKLAQWIVRNGIPDAIAPLLQTQSKGRYVAFYLDPSRSYSINDGATIATLNDVPRSIRRLTFEEKSMPPPWPVLIPEASISAFGVPSIPLPPPTKFNWSAYADDSRKVRKLLHLLTGPEATRAKAILRRLGAVAQTPGIEWTVEVFSYPYYPYAFAVPDGTLFVSDQLIREFSDDELAAAMAHLMGHVRYGHYRLVRVQVFQEKPAPAETLQEKEVSTGTLEKKPEPAATAQNKPNRAGVIALTTLADTLIISWDVFITAAALGGTPAGGGGPAGALPPKEIYFSPVGTEDVENWLEKKNEKEETPPDTESLKAARRSALTATLNTAWQSALVAQQRDLEANCLAAKYLARIGVPPETLFEILMRSSLQPPYTLQVSGEMTAFDEMYTTYTNGAFDFGKMLDAGRISEQHTTR